MEPGRGVMPRELEGAEKNQPLKRGWLDGGRVQVLFLAEWEHSLYL